MQLFIILFICICLIIIVSVKNNVNLSHLKDENKCTSDSVVSVIKTFTACVCSPASLPNPDDTRPDLQPGYTLKLLFVRATISWSPHPQLQ